MYLNGKETAVNTYDVIAIVSGISGGWTTNKLYKKKSEDFG